VWQPRLPYATRSWWSDQLLLPLAEYRSFTSRVKKSKK
jgi:hypothetical protein